MKTVRELFSTRRPIDRPIEKVIDYYAVDEKRLAAEIDEYEVTEHIEACFRHFLETFSDGVDRGQVTEIGVWVAGFYGSGKSSFTKYLGFALDDTKTVEDRRFTDLLCDRLPSKDTRAMMLSLTGAHPTAVIMLDLGAEQLASDASAPVSEVLYRKLLQWGGYSTETKLADLEFTLERRELLERFKELYSAKFDGAWDDIHNDPMVGVAHAAQIVPELLPETFPTPESFSKLRFEQAEDLRGLAERMIELARRKSGKENVLFLVDEAGQYVAPRNQLILNLDGLARNFKELGRGRVWIACTGQQTLTEIVEKAALNSAELSKLKDRFPIAINLEAQDIKEITYRRLLAKSDQAEADLKDLFSRHGQALATHTRLTGTRLFRGDPDADTFAHLYPFLPQHFDLLLELIRSLARSTGGIGLRSAIRVIQDLLVDASRLLPPGAIPIADRPIGSLACIDDIYNTLRGDIEKVLPFVAEGVDRVEKAFATDAFVVRVAKAIGALQALEDFPRTPENIAALLCPELGAPSLVDEVRAALGRLAADSECGVVDDPQAGGFLFLSAGVRPLIKKRDEHIPTGGEVSLLRNKVLEGVFDPTPSVRLQNVKEVKGGVRFEKVRIVGDGADVDFRIHMVDARSVEVRRKELLVETNTSPELRDQIVWLVSTPEELEDELIRACRSDWVLSVTRESETDRDVAQFLRAERQASDAARRRVRALLERALLEGTFVFRGRSTPVSEAGETLLAASKKLLGEAAGDLFKSFTLVPIRPQTDLAAKFLGVEELAKMTKELDPLGLVLTKGSSPRVDTDCDALAETLRALDQRLEEAGSAGRLQGSAIQDMFAAAPYGWSKDATRYLFAALLVGKEVEFHGPDGVIRGAGPAARDAVKSAVAFNRLGVSRRETPVSFEDLSHAAERLRDMFGIKVMPLEDSIAKAVKEHVSLLVDDLANLPERLRLLGLPGEERARAVVDTLTSLLQQDEVGKVSILAAEQSSLLADTKWARALEKTFDGGAEADLVRARSLVSEVRSLQVLFGAQLKESVSEDTLVTLEDDLTSNAFHERLPQIRNGVVSIVKSLARQYESALTEYLAGVERALAAVQAVPDWTRLSESEREAIAASVGASGLPPKARDGHECEDLQRLLVAGVQLLAERDAAMRAVQVEAPAELPPTDSQELVAASTLAPPGLIENAEDLKEWLDALRARFDAVIKAGKSIRITWS
ncbi:MAG: BREX system P-loop protein BrxC [Thermoleophilia bacterium]